MTTKDPFANKTFLVAGADTPVGRALALQLTRAFGRLILCGRNEDQLERLAAEVIEKKGDPLVAVVSPRLDGALTVLAERRAVHGHVHASVNAAALVESGTEEAADFARRLNKVIVELVEGRGAVRLATIWPLDAGDPPAAPADFWHVQVRVGEMPAGPGDELNERLLKPAAIAEAVLNLLRCPPGACPVDVLLEPRKVKV